MFGDSQQIVFVFFIGNTGHGADFGIAQFAAFEAFAHFREFGQGIGDADFLTSRVDADAAFEIEPMGARRHAQVFPAIVPIEFVDQDQQTVGGGVEIGREFGDFGGQVFGVGVGGLGGR